MGTAIGAPVHHLISGSGAFHYQRDYESTTRAELANPTPLNPVYSYDSNYCLVRTIKKILSYVFILPAFYNWFHALAGKFVFLPAARNVPSLSTKFRNMIPVGNDAEWKVKRIAVQVNGKLIDAMMVGTELSLAQKRWVLVSQRNGGLYEKQLMQPPVPKGCKVPPNHFKQFLTGLNANALFFNYPDVGTSEGVVSRTENAHTYRAMLSLLEDKKGGIGAEEIIGYGPSMGGGVQETLEDYPLKKDIKYVFIKDRTFSKISLIASSFFGELAAFFVKLIGWDVDSFEASKKLPVPEIVLQTAHVDSFTDISQSKDLIDYDGIVPESASCAMKLLEEPQKNFKAKKLFLGMPEGHSDPIRDTATLVERIQGMIAYPVAT